MPPSALRCCSRWLSRFKILHPQNADVSLASTAYRYSTTAAPTNENEKPSTSQPTPPPIRVALTESAGRGVFATRRIGAGDTIHTAKPIVSHPSLSAVHDGFYDVEKKADWLAFDDYCRTEGMKYPLLVKRLALMVVSGAARADILDILQPASLSQEMILKMEEGFCLLQSAFSKANIRDEYTFFLTKQWYTAALARIRINAFRIDVAGGVYEDLLSLAAASVEAESAVGNAVYMLPSFYNHDCDPNTHIIWIENADAKIKSLRDIEEGEELRICYIDASMSFDARQNLLWQGFGFKCNCLRCLSGD